MFAVLEREREETKEAESSVAALRRQVAAQREAVAALDADIEQYRARVANLRKGMFLLLTSIVPHIYPLSERERERKTLAKHAVPISAQLRACERTLCYVIEGVGQDQLLMRCSLKSGESSRSTHEVSFVLDVSSSSYKGAPLPFVFTCTN